MDLQSVQISNIYRQYSAYCESEKIQPIYEILFYKEVCNQMVNTFIELQKTREPSIVISFDLSNGHGIFIVPSMGEAIDTIGFLFVKSIEERKEKLAEIEKAILHFKEKANIPN